MTAKSTVVQEAEQIISQNLGTSSNKYDGDPDTSVIDDTLVRDPLQEEGVEQQEPEGIKKRNRRTPGKKRKAEVQMNEDGDEIVPRKKPRRKRSPKPEPSYIIPDVERKTTTFKGRLGVLHCCFDVDDIILSYFQVMLV